MCTTRSHVMIMTGKRRHARDVRSHLTPRSAAAASSTAHCPDAFVIAAPPEGTNPRVEKLQAGHEATGEASQTRRGDREMNEQASCGSTGIDRSFSLRDLLASHLLSCRSMWCLKHLLSAIFSPGRVHHTASKTCDDRPHHAA